MTIQVTVKVDSNPPGTAVRIEHESQLQDGTTVYTTLGQVGGGESWTGNLWVGQNVRLVELSAAPAAEELPQGDATEVAASDA